MEDIFEWTIPLSIATCTAKITPVKKKWITIHLLFHHIHHNYNDNATEEQYHWNPFKERKTKRKWSDVTCGLVWWSILGICALHLTHPSAHTHSSEHTHTHTHTVNTHPEQGAANAAGSVEWLGVRCLAQGHLSRGIDGREGAGYSLPPPTIPAGPETRTRDLRVTSPTLYTLSHNCPTLFYLFPSW